MKNIHLITSISLILIFCSFSQATKTDLEELGLIGNVKSVHETIFKAEMKSGEYVKGKRINTVEDYESMRTFDKRGLKTEDVRYDENGNPRQKLVYDYDDKLNRIQEDRYKSDGTLDHKSRRIYKYNENGKIAEIDWIKDDGTISYKALLSYDENGNKAKGEYFNGDGSVDWKGTYTYDDHGRCVERIDYKSNGKISYSYKYNYNEQGKVSEETWYTGGKKFLIKYFEAYDEKGNKIRTDWAEENGKVYATWTYNYVYDNKGNWIKSIELNPDKISLLTGKDEYVIERQIEYY